MRLLMIVCALALLLEGCIAKREIDECNKEDRSRCPQDASLRRSYLVGEAPVTILDAEG
jgi:hypothetical protein